MSLERVTKLATLEILFQQRAIHVAHHTFIMEGDVVISGPTIHRQAFAEADDKTAILAEIADYVSADYVLIVAENQNLQQQLAQALSENQALSARVSELETTIATMAQTT